MPPHGRVGGRLDSPIPCGRYELLERIGIGGMAEVFRARLLGPEGFQKIVVIKRALPHVASDPMGARMFFEEAKIAASIAHDGITQIFELGESENGQPFMVMEHVDGVDLSKVLIAAEKHSLRLPPWLAIHFATEALDALAYVHDHKDESGAPLGIVHRDLTPSNVMISFLGKIKLSDFGVAHFAGKSATTMVGQIKGKPSYMSPEQLAGETLDRRTDLFAVGVWLWECLTQRRLFSQKDQFALVLEIAEGERKRPSQFSTDIPSVLDALVLKALVPERNERWANAREFRSALLEVQHRLRPNIERHEVTKAIGALLGRIEPPRELSNPISVPQSLRETSFVFTFEEPVELIEAAVPPAQKELDDLDTLTGPGSYPSLFLRRRGKADRPLFSWEILLEAMQNMAKEGGKGEVGVEREVSMRADELCALAGIDLQSSDAMLASNITIVGSIATRNMWATLAVLARDRASGTLAAARTEPVTGEWYELTIRNGMLSRVMTNVGVMQLPAIILSEKLADEDALMALFSDVVRQKRPLDQLLYERSKRPIDLAFLHRLRLAELFRWSSGDYTFNGSASRAVVERAASASRLREPSAPESAAIEAPLLKNAPAILIRALDPQTLAARIGERQQVRFFRSWRFEHAVAEMELGREERAFAERLAAGTTIERALAAREHTKDAHRLLALAYVLLEADLLLSGSA